MSSVVLGVGGGIAAYKACELTRLFTESGHSVRVVPTASALRFVGAATWSALSGQHVSSQVWDDVHEVPHVRIGQSADIVVVAPATADLLAKAAHGLAAPAATNVAEAEMIVAELPNGLTAVATISSVTDPSLASSRPRLPLSQRPYYKVLIKGEQLPPKAGRADDFAWPPG